MYSYDAFGNAIGFDPSTAKTEFLYSGEQFDPKINQQYLRQRYYDPTTGRFNRLDPFFGNISDPLSLHKYAYASGDPINIIDPYGLFGVSASLGNIAMVTAIAGISATTLVGIHNSFIHKGNFLPDANLIGGSVTLSIESSREIMSKVADYVPYFASVGLPVAMVMTTLQSQLASINMSSLFRNRPFLKPIVIPKNIEKNR
ncbi:MAG: RHS repeat-associated core domain-containing protein [Planctomycetaceae bacterium]|nr:RHS repeat-associated core domain-containing protein [Planctomycetaceae bacterium]